MSMKAAKLEFLTSMLWKEAASLLRGEEKKRKKKKVRVNELFTATLLKQLLHPHSQHPII